MRIDDLGNVFYDDLDVAIVDAAGNTLFGNDPTNPAGSGIAGALTDFVLYGIPNGGFQNGPQLADAEITRDNPMPWWGFPTQLSGAAVQVSWVSDTGSPSGHDLRLNVLGGSAGDEAYMEQIIPIGGSRQRWIGHALRAVIKRSAASHNGFLAYIAGQYLTASGSATGSEESSSLSWTANVASPIALLMSQPPSDAFYLRIRVGIRRNTASASATGTFDVVEMRRDTGPSYTIVPDVADPSYGPGGLVKSNGVMTVGPKAIDPAGNPSLGSGVYEQFDGGAATWSVVSKTGLLTGSMTLGIATLTISVAEVDMSGVLLAALLTLSSASVTMSGNVNNWAPSGWPVNNLNIATGGANRTITGFDSSGLSAGFICYSSVSGAGGVTLRRSNAGSSSANQIGFPAALDPLTVTGGFTMIYDGSKWQVISYY